MYILLGIQLKRFSRQEVMMMGTGKLLLRLRDFEFSLNQVFQKFTNMTLGIELEDLLPYIQHCGQHLDFSPTFILPKTNCLQETTYDELLSTHVYNGHILEDALRKLTEFN